MESFSLFSLVDTNSPCLPPSCCGVHYLQKKVKAKLASLSPLSLFHYCSLLCYLSCYLQFHLSCVKLRLIAFLSTYCFRNYPLSSTLYEKFDLSRFFFFEALDDFGFCLL